MTANELDSSRKSITDLNLINRDMQVRLLQAEQQMVSTLKLQSDLLASQNEVKQLTAENIQ